MACKQELTPKRLINLVSVEADHDRTVDDDDRSGHVTKFLEIGECSRILRYVPLLELYAFLRKILFRLIAEHSPVLGINHDVLRHFSPRNGFVPRASKCWITSFALLIPSRTGLSEKIGFGGPSRHTVPGAYTAM